MHIYIWGVKRLTKRLLRKLTPRQLRLHKLMRAAQRRGNIVRRIQRDLILRQLLCRLSALISRILRAREEQLALLAARELSVPFSLELRGAEVGPRPDVGVSIVST